MWNSWVDREVIATIRENVKKHREWFYSKVIKGRNDRDRMENEELYMSLVYLEFQRMKSNLKTLQNCFKMYQKMKR